MARADLWRRLKEYQLRLQPFTLSKQSPTLKSLENPNMDWNWWDHSVAKTWQFFCADLVPLEVGSLSVMINRRDCRWSRAGCHSRGTITPWVTDHALAIWDTKAPDTAVTLGGLPAPVDLNSVLKTMSVCWVHSKFKIIGSLECLQMLPVFRNSTQHYGGDAGKSKMIKSAVCPNGLHWKPKSGWPSGILISFFTSSKHKNHKITQSHTDEAKVKQILSRQSQGLKVSNVGAFATRALPCHKRPLLATKRPTNIKNLKSLEIFDILMDHPVKGLGQRMHTNSNFLASTSSSLPSAATLATAIPTSS